MRIPFQGARLKPIIVGTMKRSPLINSMLPVAAGGTASARYCYAVWMRHLLLLSKFNDGQIPARVAEIGPGDSLGVGLAALLSGAQSYFALEAIEYWNTQRNLKILDDLIELFKNRAPIPGNEEFPLLKPVLDDHAFPHSILTDDILNEAMQPHRIELIREELKTPENQLNNMLQYKVPWHGEDVVMPESIDFIFSHVVLQHIDEIEEAAKAMDHWLKPGAFVSHIIDYRSLGFTKAWNGHWAIPDWEWKIMVGGRKFSVNRKPHSYYIGLFERNHLKLLYTSKDNLPNHLSKNQLTDKFRNLSEDDLSTSVGYFIGQKMQ